MTESVREAGEWYYVIFYCLSSETSESLIFQTAPKEKYTYGFQIHCYCNFSSYVANVKASKIPQDQLKLPLTLLVAEQGGQWGWLRAEVAEDFVDDLPVEFKLTLTI